MREENKGVFWGVGKRGDSSSIPLGLPEPAISRNFSSLTLRLLARIM